MYLKTLKLVGFKSFADRTRLEFRPGVTVVVGPNGAGKSNLVDAVAWVMGNQSPKSLRTTKMDDVVFAGTATRPALSRAEVTVIFDNSDRLLPIDLEEVAITRRLYRDGSSDYEINGVQCRLLDISELLSDSGVGRLQHVIVGQGQIDAILSEGPEQHRSVIEEAAGILKHRMRKEKALRRIERTDTDLVRLNDLLAELERQMRPLKRQAEAATRYLKVTAEVRSLTLYLGGNDLRRLDARLSAVEAERTTHQSQRAGIDAELVELNRMLELAEHRAASVATDLERDSTAAAHLETTVERLRRVAQVSHERHRTRQARIEGAVERLNDLEGERQALTAQIDSDRHVEGEARIAAELAERRLAGLEDEDRLLAAQENLSSEGAGAVARGDLLAMEGAAMRDAKEEESLSQRWAVIEGHLADEEAETSRLDAEIRELDNLTGAAQRAYQEAGRWRRRDQGHWEQAELAHSEARLASAAAKARLDAFRSAAQGLADPDARRLIEESRGAIGSVGGLLDLPMELAAAVDAALGGYRDAVVFSDAMTLEAAVGRLKNAGLGGVPVVIGPPGGGAPARAVAKAFGVDALVDLLGSRANPDLALHLLGDVVVVEGWSEAWKLVAKHPDIRVVTPDGDLVTGHGIRVAAPDGFTPAMVEAAATELEQSERDMARTHSLLVSARRAFEKARAAERLALEGLEELEARIAGATEALGRARRAETSHRAEAERLTERRTSLGHEAATRADAMSRLTERLAALEGAQAREQQVWEELNRRRVDLAASRLEARSAWQETVAALSAISERKALSESRLEAISAELEAPPPDERSQAGLRRLEVVEGGARQAIEVLRAHIETLRSRQADLRDRASQTSASVEEMRRRHTALTDEAASSRERLNVLTVEAAELRVRREAAAESLRREVDASEEQALSEEMPNLDPGVDATDRLTSKRAELRRMGQVNPLAADEYAQMAERHQFLDNQLGDLQRSRRELDKVIKALDEEIEQQFLEAFHEVSYSFEQHFGVLFPGGRGRLRLGDPESPLTSGVEIDAQPLGKKVSQLSLLSGGERSLAALAFLFAVFKARPSPFYLLDEVEAALDDANLRRFLRLVEVFRADAQLVVVTHQQQTMEVADVLYGVTMEPGGSSKVIAKQLTAAGHKL
jgi:chromosome segregation protein